MSLTFLDVDKLLEPFMVKVLDSNNQQVWKCLECGKISKYITNLKGHVEANHFHLKFNCKFCAKVFKSRGSLRNHVSNFHKERNACPASGSDQSEFGLNADIFPNFV